MPATLLNRHAAWLVAILISSFSGQAQPITLFPGLTVKNDPYVNLIADALGGGYFLATQVDAVNGTPTGNIAKVSNSGSVDPDFERVVVNGDIVSIVPLQNGQLLIAGRFTKVNGLAYHGIARLESDGSLDTSFPVPFDPLVDVGRIALQSDGKIIVVGHLLIAGHNTVLRLNTDGTLDATFVYDPVTLFGSMLNVVVDSQDNIWLSDGKSIFRLNPAGTIQSGFPISVGAGMSVYYLVPKADKLYVGGPFTSISGVSRRGMALVNADGSIDAGFVPPAFVTDVSGIKVKNDGKVVALHLNSVNVYNADGSFMSQIASSQPESIHVDQNQYTLVSGGTNLLIKENLVPFLGRVNNTFTIDNSFICKPTYSHGVTSLAGYPDGRILVGGTYDMIGFNSSLKRLVRVNRDGTVDPTFEAAIPSSSVLPKFSIVSLHLQSDEKIVVTTNEQMFRLLPGGGTDNFFGQVNLPYPDLISRSKEKSGKLMLAGAFDVVGSLASPGIVRLSANGVLDNSFTSGLPSGSYVTDFAFQSDNKVIVVGYFPASPTAKSEMRLNPNGGIDNSYTSGSIAANGVWKVGVDSQDKIYISGSFNNYDGSGRNHLVRLGPNGQLDATFNFAPATFHHLAQVESLEILSDNEIVVGSRQTYGDHALYVFNATGGLIDKPFTHLGQNPSVTSMSFNGQTLYLGGHLVSSNSDVTSGLGVVNIVPVTGTIDNLAVSRSSRYQAEITWDNNTSNGNFLILERSEGGPNSFVQLAVLNTSIGSYSDVGIKGVAEYHYRIKAFNSSSVSAYSAGSISALPKLDQTITFESISDKSAGDAPFALVFSATSGLVVTVSSSDPSIASVANNIVTIHSHGEVTLTAAQGGDLEHNAAPDVERSFTVNLALTVTRSSRYQATLTWVDHSGGSIVIERSEGNSNSFVEIATIPISSANYADNGIKGVAEYYYRIRDQSAVTYSNMVSIPALPKLDQTITFAAIPPKILADDPFVLTFSASSGLPVTVSSSDSSVATVTDGIVTIQSIGTVTFTAQQSGDLEHNAAPNVDRTLVVTLVMDVAGGPNLEEARIAFPNPSEGSFVVSLEKASFTGTAYVLSSNGSLMATLPVQTENGQIQFNLSNYPSGLYILKLTDGKSQSTFKLSKQ